MATPEQRGPQSEPLVVVRFSTQTRPALEQLLATQLAAGDDITVPSTAPFPVGTQVMVEAHLAGGEAALHVPAMIMSHVDGPTPSVVLRWAGPPSETPAQPADYGHTSVEGAKVGASAGSTARSLEPFEALGNYLILKRLGGGGMAQVYLARSRLGGQVDKLVALKTVLPEFGPKSPLGALFLDEARVSATLQHTNVVQVFDYGEADGRPYLAMEYVHGRTVGALMQRLLGRNLPARFDAAVAIVIEVCRALEYVHDRRALDGSALNLVHRDVTPSNIMLSPQGEVKLLDFGVAAADGSALVAGQAVGKYGYMSLEQARGGAPSPSWDVFALGVVLYELLTLKRRCKASSVEELQQYAARDDDRRPSLHSPSLPPELDALVVKATSFQSSERFASASDFRRALLEVQPTVGSCDLKRFVDEVFGAELQRDEEATQALVHEGRAHHTVPPRARSSTAVRVVGLAGALLVGALVSGWLFRHSAPPVAETPIIEAQLLKPAADINATFTSSPGGAAIIRVDDGSVLGTTPARLTLPRGDGELAVRFELPDYVAVQRHIRLTSDVAVDVTLAAEPLPVPVPHPKPPHTPKKQRHREVVRDGFVDPFAQ